MHQTVQTAIIAIVAVIAFKMVARSPKMPAGVRSLAGTI